MAARPGRLWALAVLHRQGVDITTRPAAVAAPRVELPAVPGDVRAAIVRHHAPGERHTDPRWLVELAFADPHTPRPDSGPPVEVDGQLQRVRTVFDSAGLAPGAGR